MLNPTKASRDIFADVEQERKILPISQLCAKDRHHRNLYIGRDCSLGASDRETRLGVNYDFVGENIYWWMEPSSQLPQNQGTILDKQSAARVKMRIEAQRKNTGKLVRNSWYRSSPWLFCILASTHFHDVFRGLTPLPQRDKWKCHPWHGLSRKVVFSLEYKFPREHICLYIFLFGSYLAEDETKTLDLSLLSQVKQRLIAAFKDLRETGFYKVENKAESRTRKYKQASAIYHLQINRFLSRGRMRVWSCFLVGTEAARGLSRFKIEHKQLKREIKWHDCSRKKDLLL